MTDRRLTTEDTAVFLADAEAFAQMLDDAARGVFGNSDLAFQLRAVTRSLLDDCRRLHARGHAVAVPLVLVGSVGEGKSWLARCFLQDHPDNQAVRAEIKSGQNDDERTARLTWFGPQRPAGFDDAGEQFLQVAAERMLELGRPYVVGDTPGFTDADAAHRQLSALATTSAPIKIVVTSVTELRDGRSADFVRGMDGALILPVVKFRPAGAEHHEPGDKTQQDVRAELSRWQRAAPTAEILPPVFMPLQDIAGAAEAERRTRERLREALVPQLARSEHLRQTIDRQIRERILRARAEAAALLAGFAARVGRCVDRLEAQTGQFPERLVQELLGEDLALRIGLRQRFRADWIDRTPLICFPYRSFLGLLALTAGAWDRLMLSFVGSWPSLALTVFQSLKNVRDAAATLRRLRGGLASRLEKLIEDDFRPEVIHFQTALAATLPEQAAGPGEAADATAGSIRVQGLEGVETASRTILRQAIDQHRAWTFTVWLLALVGTGTFLYLAIGPAVALYRTYLAAHWGALHESETTWDQFPVPGATMLLASFVLSALPAFLAALVGMWWSCRSRRVRASLQMVKKQHAEEIQRRTGDGSLRIVLTNPRLAAARFLLGLAPRGPHAAEGQL